jgi:hypothetical protein
MFKKLIYFVSFVLVLSIVGNASADLVVHWGFDEGSGSMVHDASGNGHDGTINGTPQWVPGIAGGALHFDGSTYVVVADDIGEFETFSIALWFKYDSFIADWNAIWHNNSWQTGWLHHMVTNYAGQDIRVQFALNGLSPGNDQFGITPIETDVWYHSTVTYDSITGQMNFYLTTDEERKANLDVALSVSGPATIITAGQIGGWEGGRLSSATFDDIRMYDHILSEVEILGAMAGKIWPYALGPVPADGAIHPDTWVNLSWTSGGHAVSHDMYLSDNFDDVNDGTEGAFQGNQAATFLVAGFPGFPYPDGLVPGTTYYWRIDEVNDIDPNSPWKGDVWSFMVPPKTAYAPAPADAAEQVDPDANLSWTAGFGSKLHTVYFGESFDEVDSAAGNFPQGAATYDPGTLKLAKTYYWRVDEFDAIDTYKGHVWSFTTEGAVVSLKPSNGAVDVKQTQILTWAPGVYGASHEVYFGTDKEAVRNADTGSPEYKGAGDLGAESFDPGKLEWNTTYYWRIDEANNVNPDSPWTGNVWSFTTANFLVVDDFENYNDLDPTDPESNRIFNAWIDGYDDPTNGSLVGYDTPPFAEQTIVHSGNQSMPFFYDNSVGYSEATLTLTYPRDWTENDVNKLAIWFRGSSANAAETLYVALNGNAIVTNDNPDAAQVTTWTEWTIDLQAFADQGVNLSNVDTISLGLGNKSNPQAGGSGTMYFDDIRLYALEPETP